ncbi:MAG TPA: UDP-N-acetylmuramyl pentapeptide phosphotransferase [Desulfotignum sp.]|nr:UDP-N-acetylmuramyl pentapeptide phosphotransferase [Desulfotignum sp.]
MMFAISGFLLGVAGSWLVMRYGDRIGAMDVPNFRSSHDKMIPKGAGLGILAALVVTGLVLKIPFFIWIPALAISLASFWGADRHILPVLHRLGIHFGCALFFLVFFLHAKGAGPGAYVRWLPVLVFIVGTANFYNFMDGIDGIAGITGFLAFLLMAVYAGISAVPPVFVSLNLALAFACLGFLFFNFPVAKVFLGDVGSILLGFVFACLVIFLSQDLADFLVMAGFLALFYFDEMVTMAVRIKNGDSLVAPHRKHIYQVLVNEAGIGHWKVSVGYGAVQLLVGVLAMWLHPGGAWPLLAMYLFFGLIFTVFSIIVRKRFPSSEN